MSLNYGKSPSVPQLALLLNEARTRALDVVEPAVEEIALLGRYRVAKIRGVNSGLAFRAVIAPIAETTSRLVPAAITAILRFDPALADATAEEFEQRMHELRAKPGEGAKEAKRLLPMIEKALQQKYPNRLSSVPSASLFGRPTMTISPDEVPLIQIAVATGAGISLPPIDRKNLDSIEIAAEAARTEAYEMVFSAQRTLVSSVNSLLRDFDLAQQLNDELHIRDVRWALAPTVYNQACRAEGSAPEGPSSQGRNLGHDGLDL